MLKYSTAITAALLLAGCATANGPTYPVVEQSFQPKPGKAELIIYRPSSFWGQALKADVGVAGGTCAMPNQSYIVRYAEPGPVVVTAEAFGSPGTSNASFNAKADNKYFVRVAWNQDKIDASTAFGLVGMIGAEAMSSHSGPFAIEVLNEVSALPELSAAKLVTSCQ